MKNRFHQLLALAFVLAGAAPGSIAANAVDTRPRAGDEALQAALEEIRERHGVPGLAAAVFDRDAVRAFGVGELGGDAGPVTPDSRFRIGQASILFTGMAMAALIADGSIPSDAIELRDVAPEIDLHNPWVNERPVRIADLLSHRAGLGITHFRDVYAANPGQPLLAGINSAFRALRVESRPGDREQFSALGAAIAAYLVEKATGFAYEDVLARMFFDPLDATASVGRASGPLPGDAIGHASGAPVQALPLNFVTAGGVWISAADFGRVGQLLLNRGRLAEREILKTDAVAWLESPAEASTRVPGARHGVHAEAFNGFLFHTQTGALPGFLARFAYSPDLGRGWLVLLNDGNAREALAEADALLRGQVMAAPPAAPPVPPPDATAAEMPSLDGWYRSTAAVHPPAALYRSWLGLARVRACGDGKWCFEAAGRSRVLEAFDATRLREAGSWYPGWEVAEDGLSLLAGEGAWERVPGWQAVAAMSAAAFVILGILAGAVLLPAWTVSLLRRRAAGRYEGYRDLLPRLLPLVAIAAFVALQLLLFTTGYPALGRPGTASIVILVLSIAVPGLALLGLVAAAAGVAWRLPVTVSVPALLLAGAAAVASAGMISAGLFAFQPWNY